MDVIPRFYTNSLFAINTVKHCLVYGCLGLYCLLGMQAVAQGSTNNTAISTRAAENTIVFAISAGPLASILTRFAQAADIYLSGDVALSEGKTSEGLKGRYTVEQGLSILLQGQNITYRFNSKRSVVLLANDAPTGTLNILNVSHSLLGDSTREGSAEQGYRVSSLNQIGPIQGRSLIETPYTINVASQALIENMQAATPEDIQRFSPFVQINQRQASGFTNFVNIRGFTGSGWTQKFEEGMRASSLSMVSMEDKAKVEVLSGLSGFLYGMTNPGGVINYVLKRPTFEPLYKLSVGNYGGSSYFAHADVSDRLNRDGSLAYRLNMVYQDGDTAVDEQSKRRYLISAALDYELSESALLQFAGSHGYDRVAGPHAVWQFLGAEHPKAFDNSKQWGQTWSYSQLQTSALSAALTWDVNEAIRVRSSISHSRTEREHVLSANIVSPALLGPGNYTPVLIFTAPQQHDNTAGYFFTDMLFTLGGSQHKLTLGYSGDHYKTHQPRHDSTPRPLGALAAFGDTLRLNSVGLDDLTRAQGRRQRIASRANNNNFILTDDITFNQHWSLIAGITRASIRQSNYDFEGNGALTEQYDRFELTPSVSLIYKPVSELSLYATYIEGLEQGSTAPVNANNSGDLLAPVVSEQYEVGAKWAKGGVLISAALFDIKRANEFLDTDNIFKQQGFQRNRGIEFSATGKVNKRLTIISGATVLDAKVESTGNNDPVGVAEKLAKLYTEYNLASVVDGLTVTGGIIYTGESAVDTENTQYLPSYTLVDVGARYVFTSDDTPVSLSMNIKNVTGKDYWVNNNYLGDPRTVTFSAQVSF